MRLLARFAFTATYALVISIAIFIFILPSVAGILILSLLSIAMVSYLLGVSSYSFGTGYALWIDTWGRVDRSADDERTWLSLHFIYGLGGLVSLFISLFVFAYAIAYPEFLGQTLLIGFMVIFGQLTLCALLRMLGHGYENLSGVSFTGVVAIARLSERMIIDENRKGILYLFGSLRMLRILFSRRGHMPEKLGDVIATVESESEVKDPKYQLLGTLEGELQSLPERRKLPQAFQTFLSKMKWPAGFEPHPPSRIRIREILSIGFSAAVAVGAISLIFPVESRSLFESMVGFILQNPLFFLILPLAVSFFIAGKAIAFIVPYRLSRKYLTESRISVEVSEKAKSVKGRKVS